ncbi:MAG: hypothetical protein ACK5L6_06655 [Anaerorhabdus sp.]|uniref:hypothetical protein n=1 Tax=Anaerorhabdus sp. TaxID=1872524 RepID=UPI003A85CA3D
MKYIKILLISCLLVSCKVKNTREVQYPIFYDNSAELLGFELSQIMATVKISSNQKLPEIGKNDILVYFDTSSCAKMQECYVQLHVKVKNAELLKMKAQIKVEPSQIKLVNIKHK